MHYHRLRIGQRVYNVTDRHPIHCTGTIVAITADRVVIHWDGLLIPSDCAPQSDAHWIRPVCRHCNRRFKDHAEGGKCLFSPTSWEN